MRGIGTGQRIHVMIIPEVAELMQREEDAAARNAAAVAAELSDSLKDGGDRQTLSENISALAASGGGSSLSRSSSSSGGSRSAGSSRAVSRSNSADYPSENDDDDDDNAGEESASAVAITSLAVSKVHNALQAAAALPKIASMSDFRTGEDDDDDDDDDGNNGGSGEKYPDALLLPAPDKPPKSLARELSEGSLSTKKVLEQIVAWLVVNSMRSEQTQWSMLCIQNVSNIYRKTAFEVMLRSAKKLVGGSTKGGGGVGDGSVASDATAAAAAAGAAAAAASSDASSSMPEPLSFGGTATSSTSTSTSGGGASSEGGEIMGVALDASSGEALCQLTPRECVGVFEEDIDFSLEAAVPDPMPFEAKLRAMLDDNEAFIVDAIGHAVGAGVLAEVSE